ncbi:hypothetical protein P3X46_020947 [Hevea brasiliensis]|uniref:Uncharacterized protein n=1 Tax=Hevea brasiliensis TaxID=3981 RepID=A0ABQ9LHH4_HEVBR|nr:hypothetical protein P3X46_020947 [Hevea brasiliensis]
MKNKFGYWACYRQSDTATTAAAFTPARVTGAVVSYGSKTQKRTNKVVYIGGQNSLGDLMPHKSVVSLVMPVSTERVVLLKSKKVPNG